MSAIADKIAETEAGIAFSRTAKNEALIELEEAILNELDVKPVRKRIAEIENSMDIAQATLRGLARRRVLEERAELESAIIEGESNLASLTQVHAQLQQHVAELAVQLASTEHQEVAARVARDNAGMAVSSRRRKLAAFLHDRAADIQAAERTVTV